MTRVLVCGGRDFINYEQLCRVLDALHEEKQFNIVIQGEAKGADSLAKKWAEDKGIDVRSFHANWQKYGKGAGPIRNKMMLTIGKPDLVVAFPGGRGTANMVHQAKNAGVEVIEVEIDE